MELVAAINHDLENASADFKPSTTQSTADRNLLDGVRTARAHKKSTLQQRASTHTRYRETLSAEKAVFETEFRRFPEGIQANIDRTKTSLGGEAARTSSFNN